MAVMLDSEWFVSAQLAKPVVFGSNRRANVSEIVRAIVVAVFRNQADAEVFLVLRPLLSPNTLETVLPQTNFNVNVVVGGCDGQLLVFAADDLLYHRDRGAWAAFWKDGVQLSGYTIQLAEFLGANNVPDVKQRFQDQGAAFEGTGE